MQTYQLKLSGGDWPEVKRKEAKKNAKVKAKGSGTGTIYGQT
jgi:hypothetical protein